MKTSLHKQIHKIQIAKAFLHFFLLTNINVILPSPSIQDASMSCVRLPYTSTCALELFLPRGAAGAADLLMLLSRAVHEALGYTHLQKEEHEEDKCIQIKKGLWGVLMSCWSWLCAVQRFLKYMNKVTLTCWLGSGSCSLMKRHRLLLLKQTQLYNSSNVRGTMSLRLLFTAESTYGTSNTLTFQPFFEMLKS